METVSHSLEMCWRTVGERLENLETFCRAERLHSLGENKAGDTQNFLEVLQLYLHILQKMEL
jgi:hypothetical protein